MTKSGKRDIPKLAWLVVCPFVVMCSLLYVRCAAGYLVLHHILFLLLAVALAPLEEHSYGYGKD